jgi:hypothetical protein
MVRVSHATWALLRTFAERYPWSNAIGPNR